MKMTDPNPTSPSTVTRLVDPDRKDPGKPRHNVLGEGSTLAPRTLEPAPPSEDVEKLRESYKKLESERGRQANEIGQLRKQLEQLQQAPKEEPANYWSDPEKAVEQKIKPLASKISQLEAEKLRAELKAIHPDYQDVVSKPEFSEWVKEKRSRLLLAMSGESGDVEAASELLTEYKSALETGNATPQEAVRRDRLARSGAAEKGTPRRPAGQVYRRAELQNMRAFNPRKYEEMLPDIRRAYQEGRVVD
jgi:DNA repair exonuclease SbcCD ATPase subunit